MPHVNMQIVRDMSGAVTYCIPITDVINRGALTTNTVATVTAPTEGTPFYMAVFSYSAGANIWVDLNGNTATVPATDSESSTASLNPLARKVASGQSISLITADAAGAQYSIEFYEIPRQ